MKFPFYSNLAKHVILALSSYSWPSAYNENRFSHDNKGALKWQKQLHGIFSFQRRMPVII